jgi:hypothetical protein
MLKMLKKFNVDFEADRVKYIPDKVLQLQFTSKRKRMTTVVVEDA